MISFIMGLLPSLAPLILKGILNLFEKDKLNKETKERVLKYIKVIEKEYGGSAGKDADDWEKINSDADKMIEEIRKKKNDSQINP